MTKSTRSLDTLALDSAYLDRSGAYSKEMMVIMRDQLQPIVQARSAAFSPVKASGARE